MTLAEVSLGAVTRISGFSGLSEADLTRLSALGLRVGERIVKILKTPLRDPIECLVGPQLVAVESWLLERILVEKP